MKIGRFLDIVLLALCAIILTMAFLAATGRPC